jgi:ABC-type nitrate/sulfonate/bicarbonate transport system substrate-binding protein
MKSKLAVAAALLSLTLARASAGEPAKDRFVVKYPNIQWFDPVYVADEKGWFAEEGLEIQWVGEVPAAQLVPAVAAGSIDFANRHTPLVLTARAGGAKLRIVAAGAQTTAARPHMKYLVVPGSPIRSVKDLKGKKIGINSFGACSEYVLKEYLRTERARQGRRVPGDPDRTRSRPWGRGSSTWASSTRH